ncbi:MAG: hypothetical protein ACRDHE_11100 [Ktedonobacterales bacterium]
MSIIQSSNDAGQASVGAGRALATGRTCRGVIGGRVGVVARGRAGNRRAGWVGAPGTAVAATARRGRGAGAAGKAGL